MAQNNQTVGNGIATGASGVNTTLFRTANQTNPYDDPKSFFKFIPNFNGTKGSCSTRAFIKYCEKSKTYLNQTSERSIVYSLMGKFRGEYAKSIADEDIDTIDNLITFIRLNFEDPAPIPYTTRILEFGSIRQGQYERVLVYGERVTKILREIVDDITQSDADGKEERKKIVTQFAVRAFIKGLRPQYVRLLKTLKFERLALAIKEATEAETLCTEYPNLGIENNTVSCFNVQREQKQNTRTPHTNNKHCNYCNRVGHEWSECRVRKRDNDFKYGNTQNTRNINQKWNNTGTNYNNQNNMNTNNRNNIPNNSNQNYKNNRSNNNQYSDNNRRNNSNYQNNRFNANRNQRQNNQNNSSNQYNI
ncbi:hypothetical protein PV328_010435 [Microctonus aethiopoides]|uniref:Uncharacterized protein n=1 Tax=Microctonus aethiopoides TaxID=144406 RepID=A0AA39KQ98_9HYME|nr:hypothetical protein PV328_010435 [Microctonus aethiopoides]